MAYPLAFLALLLWIAASGHVLAQAGPVEMPPASATATISSRALAVGAVGTLEVSATFASAPRWVEIDLGALAPVFEVRRVKTGRTFGRRRQWTIEIAAFEPGPATIPLLTINGALGAGPSGPLATTPAIDIEITSPVVAATDPLQVSAGRLGPPPLPLWLRLAAAIAAAAAAVVLVVSVSRSMGRYLRHRRRTREFWQATLNELRQLSERSREASGEDRRSTLHAAARIIKLALAAALDWRVRGRSSADVVAILGEQPKYQKVRDRSATLFDSLDRQRFGPKRGSGPEDSPLPEAVALVERLPKRLRSEDGR